MESPGKKLRRAWLAEQPLQIVGVLNALCAKFAKEKGFQAIYLSGAGVANAKLAVPDLGLISLNDIVEETWRITAASSLPLIVDADTGFGSPLNVQRTFKLLSQAGAAGAHIEDQHLFKRCGHRSHKRLVSATEMVSRIQAAIEGRLDPDFVVIARTDALASEGKKKALERAFLYQAAGADAIFLEAATTLAEYELFSQKLSIPILANITEFGKTPLFTVAQLKQAGVGMALYPLSAFRAMNAAALTVYDTIRKEGTQQALVSLMQSRQDLYHYLAYEKAEKILEAYFENAQKPEKKADP